MASGLIIVAVHDLLDGHLDHGVDEFGVEVALVAGVGLLGLQFHLAQCLCVGNGFVDGCVKRGSEREEQNRR